MKEFSCEHCGCAETVFEEAACDYCGQGMCASCTQVHDDEERCPLEATE
jgi:hypothetical protein